MGGGLGAGLGAGFEGVVKRRVDGGGCGHGGVRVIFR